MKRNEMDSAEEKMVASEEEQRFLEAIQDPEKRAKIISILTSP